MQFPVLWAGQVKAWPELVDVQYNLIMRSSHLCIGVTRCQITLFKEQNKTSICCNLIRILVIVRDKDTVHRQNHESHNVNVLDKFPRTQGAFFSGTDLNLECLHKKKILNQA